MSAHSRVTTAAAATSTTTATPTTTVTVTAIANNTGRLRVAWGYRIDQASNLYDQGDEFGDNRALIEACRPRTVSGGVAFGGS